MAELSRRDRSQASPTAQQMDARIRRCHCGGWRFDDRPCRACAAISERYVPGLEPNR